MLCQLVTLPLVVDGQVAKVIVPQPDKTHSRLCGQFTEGRVFQFVDEQTKIQHNRKMNKTKKDIKIFIFDPTNQISAFLLAWTLESGKSIPLPKKEASSQDRLTEKWWFSNSIKTGQGEECLLNRWQRHDCVHFHIHWRSCNQFCIQQLVFAQDGA